MCFSNSIFAELILLYWLNNNYMSYVSMFSAVKKFCLDTYAFLEFAGEQIPVGLKDFAKGFIHGYAQDTLTRFLLMEVFPLSTVLEYVNESFTVQLDAIEEIKLIQHSLRGLTLLAVIMNLSDNRRYGFIVGSMYSELNYLSGRVSDLKQQLSGLKRSYDKLS